MSSTSSVPRPEGPRHATVTPDDHGALLQIAAWFLMVVMILATILRLTLRFTTAHIPGLDDAVVSLATSLKLTGIGEVVAISFAVNAGLGKRLSLLVAARMTVMEKDVYASTILYITTLALAKASTLLLIARLAMIKAHQMIIRGLSITVLLWFVASIISVSFQCGLPDPWDYSGSRCFSPIPFWNVVATFDILVDAALIGLPTAIVWSLHMQWQKKMVVIVAFAFRLAPIAAQVARLSFLRRLQDSQDIAYDVLAFDIATQTQMALAVIVASIPAYKPFMDRASSGMMAISLGGRDGTYGISGSYAMHSLSKQRSDVPKQQEAADSERSGRRGLVSSAKQLRGTRDSQRIHKTTDFEVRYSDETRLDPQRKSADDSNDEQLSVNLHTDADL